MHVLDIFFADENDIRSLLHLTKKAKNEISLEKTSSSCATVTELLDEVLEKECWKICFSRGVATILNWNLSGTSHWLELLHCRDIFVHSPTHECVPDVNFLSSRRFVTFGCVKYSRHATCRATPMDFYITADVETPFNASRV